jgi:nucleotide-binding universal stress UspA family protein
MLLKNVLVAVDGSENSDRALDFALDLAEKFDASVTILNVSELLAMGAVPQESSAYPSGSIALLAKDLMAIQNEIITKNVNHAKAVKPNLAISSLSKEGDAVVEIVNTAEEGGFDLIVVGHKGVGKMRERFLGSVSENVAHNAPCPVLIVK